VPVIAALGFALAGCASSGPQFSDNHHARYHRGQPSYRAEPYQVKGVWYTPKVDYGYDETGTASWYGPGFNGRPTATGEIYNQDQMTAASSIFPLGSRAIVTDLASPEARAAAVRAEVIFNLAGQVSHVDSMTDPVFDLDVKETVMNAVQREAATGVSPAHRVPRLSPEDFVVHRSDTLTRSATVLMLDMSRSMPLRGYFYAAKKVALALDSLIRSTYPRDTLHVIGFSDLAREISPAALPHLSVNEYVYGTNMQHGLMLARRLLAKDPGENKQIIIVSDGEPTAHIENGRPVFFYPPLPETFHKTLLEVKRCTRENIVINTFMLESNHHLVQFVNQMTRLNRGRAFFISPDRLGDYVLVDYVSSKRGAA